MRGDGEQVAVFHGAAFARAVGRAADILGHSEKMLVRHYRRAMLPEDAEKMLGITPSQLGL